MPRVVRRLWFVRLYDIRSLWFVGRVRDSCYVCTTSERTTRTSLESLRTRYCYSRPDSSHRTRAASVFLISARLSWRFRRLTPSALSRLGRSPMPLISASQREVWAQRVGEKGTPFFVLVGSLLCTLPLPMLSGAAAAASGLLFGTLWGTLVFTASASLGALCALLLVRSTLRAPVQRAAFRWKTQFKCVTALTQHAVWPLNGFRKVLGRRNRGRCLFNRLSPTPISCGALRCCQRAPSLDAGARRCALYHTAHHLPRHGPHSCVR